MECPECSWWQVGVGIIAGGIITYVSLWAIRNPFKPLIERHFEDNSKHIRTKILQELSRTNFWINSLVNEFEKIDNFGPKGNFSYTVSKYHLDDIKYKKERIKEIWKRIQILHDSPNTITFDEYLIIQKFVTAVHSIAGFISNNENGVYFDFKAFEFAKYYAKQIMLKIDDLVLNNFKSDWQSVFDREGGIDKIKEPKMEPGDVLSTHHNLHDELFYYDAKFSGIMEGFREVMKEFVVVKEELKKLQEKK